MGTLTNQIATETEARQIGGGGTQYSDTKCVTKTKAINLGCSIRNNYEDNQTVKHSDLYKAPVPYTITINQVTGGTIRASKSSAYAGEIITLSYSTNTNYTFNGYIVKQGTTNINVSSNKFTMPKGNVTVTGSFTYHNPDPGPGDDSETTFYNKVCVLSVYNTAGGRHILNGWSYTNASTGEVTEMFRTRNTYQYECKSSNIIEQQTFDNRGDDEVTGDGASYETTPQSFDCCSKDVCVVLMVHGGMTDACTIKCTFNGTQTVAFDCTLTKSITDAIPLHFVCDYGNLYVTSVAGDIGLDDTSVCQIIKVTYIANVITAEVATASFQNGEEPYLLTRLEIDGDGTGNLPTEPSLAIDFNYYNANSSSAQNLKGDLGNMNYLLGLQNIQIETYKNHDLTTPTLISPMFNVGAPPFSPGESISYAEESAGYDVNFVCDSCIDGNVNWPHYYAESHSGQIEQTIGFIQWYTGEIVHGFKLSWNRYSTNAADGDITITMGYVNHGTIDRDDNWVFNGGEFENDMLLSSAAYATLEETYFAFQDERNTNLKNGFYSVTLSELRSIYEKIQQTPYDSQSTGSHSNVSFVNTDGENFVAFNWDALRDMGLAGELFNTLIETGETDQAKYNNTREGSLYVCLAYRSHRYVFLFEPYKNWDNTDMPSTLNSFIDFVPNANKMLQYKEGNGSTTQLDTDNPYSNYILNHNEVYLLENNTTRSL